MSNDKAIARAFKLWAKISIMIVDDPRGASVVADALQVILNRPTFSLTTFIGKDWSYDEARDSRSAALGTLDDYSRVTLSSDWLQGSKRVDGETRRRPILKDQSFTSLNCDHFFDLWNNKEKIPESWKNVGVITFDGDVLRDPNGSRYVLCLCWGGGKWNSYYYWLGHDSGIFSL